MIGKYKYTEGELKQLLASIVILVDTREQVNDHIKSYYDSHKIPWKSKALEQGDYSFYVPQNEELSIPRDAYFNDEIIIERKASLDELATNFSKGRDRFEKEFSIAKAPTRYLLIENATYGDIVNKNYRSDYNVKSYIGSFHSFNHKYGLQIVFMPDKHFSPLFIYGTFQYYLRNLIK